MAAPTTHDSEDSKFDRREHARVLLAPRPEVENGARQNRTIISSTYFRPAATNMKSV